MNSNNPADGQRRQMSSAAQYPQASHICTRHGSSIAEGQRRVYARNTFLTRDPQEKVLQYYSEQFGQPQQQAGAVCWQQETHSGKQHFLLELTVETPQAGQDQTVIKSYLVVTSDIQAG
ncbi:hypothetical protein [Thiothrix nivea]|uniref:Uncharacterized protein n=1 Tax=Thiothrix nivea (strain ATCC 35100 / DSM 5205 / JP2) TaxID=870187 RepID=A0A656HK50_THINJ|nr:hypothetical protein [Thiothrix nivea]EIJ35395.1 hypothetical protein Thini_2862 [Thiothrix nivea DSM 5205]